MSASASKSGTYAIGPGIIGLKMNINLPVREVMQLPTSVAATVPEPGTIAQRASGALALALLYRFRRSRRLPSRPATRQSARVDEGLREPEAGVG
jgi:hypothetical protein